ncbi:LuxR C-terminal-related transcriptional regulator [Streptosporangium subroseum]|uniref:helix-turn-helix transcriptional regulator n=1 Tax=Streptosporangium subroseum TaxID=106412 RepID=UPI003428B288
MFAARRLGTEPVAVLFTARDPERSTVDTSDLPELWPHGLPPLDAARLLAECGWDLPSRARDSLLAVTGGNPLALTELYYYQATIEYRLGQWNDGVAYAEEGLRFAHETGQRSRIANHLALLAQFAAARGANEDCRRYAGQALEIALPMRERCAAGVATAALGLLALGEGEPEEAWAHLTRLITPGSPYAHPHTVMTVITDVVEAAVRAGQAKLVLGLLEGIERWVEADPTPTGSAGVHHCRALLAGVDDSATELHFQHALAAQDVAERPFSRGRTKLLHGEWLRRNQRRVEARIPLRAALEAFERIGAEPWARRAHSELRATGAGVHRAGSIAGLLSAQELEVARLAADGLTNREIGERLVLSPRTVGSHLYRLFPKLGISTRSQLRNLDLG